MSWAIDAAAPVGNTITSRILPSCFARSPVLPPSAAAGARVPIRYPSGAQTTFTNGIAMGTVNRCPTSYQRFSEDIAVAGPIGRARVRSPVSSRARR